VFPSDQSNFWCLDIFLLGHCVTWESESEEGFMTFYWQWENVRVYRLIALLCVYTTSMCLHHLYVSTPPLCVYPTSTCLYHLYVYTHHYLSTPPQRVYPTSTCLPHLHVSTPPLRVYLSFTYVIQFRTHGEFENENTFALAWKHVYTCTHTAAALQLSGDMRIRKRRRIHENLSTVGKRTSPQIQASAMTRIVQEMIRCRVLPNVKSPNTPASVAGEVVQAGVHA